MTSTWSNNQNFHHLKMASEEVEILSDPTSDRSSKNSNKTEAIDETESSSALSGKFPSDVWSYYVFHQVYQWKENSVATMQQRIGT